ncbi:MAG: hypothetical protein RLZZ298_389 [Pseudomonadota bacterium]|jgi:hypothetical protein
MLFSRRMIAALRQYPGLLIDHSFTLHFFITGGK